MFKITLLSPLEKVYHFIDNRLVLQMAEKKLRQKGALAKFWIKDIKQNVDDTIFYVEKEPNRGTLIIIPTEKVGQKVKSHPCGMTLRERHPNEFDLYIDLVSQAVKKGILSSKQVRITPKFIWIILGIILLISALAFFPIFVLACITVIVLYPILYLIERRRFRHNQEIIATIVSLFEGEFQTKNKVDTKDWVNFWGRVKSGVKEAIIPS